MSNDSRQCSALSGSPQDRISQLSALAGDYAHTDYVRKVAAMGSLELLLSTVQLLPYKPDPAGVDVVCPPERTMAEGGDCEDRALLFAAVAKAKGASVQIVWVEQSGAPQDHVSVKIERNGAWLWADPTVVGARIGEAPADAAARTGAGGERLWRS